MELPKGVHRVVSRGKEYFYYQPGRNTPHAQARVKLPNDPQSPEFWVAVRQAQGIVSGPAVETFADVCDAYEISPQFRKLSKGTQALYRRSMKPAKQAWGKLAAEGLSPPHVLELMDALGDVPGAANSVLAVLRAISTWGVLRRKFPQSITAGVKPYAATGGHKPWTPEQLAAAEEHLTGSVRRAFFLARYTGQRGSDVVRLGPTFIDDGGFKVVQEKTGVEVWCPITEELSAEMSGWELVPGSYVRHATGKPFTRKVLDRHFKEQRDAIPALKDCTLHGLRSTRVIELRRAGLSTSQIQDQVGMSMAMIERYCRFADKKANGKASVVHLAERRKNGISNG